MYLLLWRTPKKQLMLMTLSSGNGGQGRGWETFAFQMTPLKTFFYHHGFHSEWLRVTVLEPRL